MTTNVQSAFIFVDVMPSVTVESRNKLCEIPKSPAYHSFSNIAKRLSGKNEHSMKWNDDRKAHSEFCATKAHMLTKDTHYVDRIIFVSKISSFCPHSAKVYSTKVILPGN